MNAIGTQFIHPTHGPLTITGRPNFYGTNQPSSIYTAEDGNGNTVNLHENIVNAVINNEEIDSLIFIARPVSRAKPKVKTPRTAKTPLDKAAQVISDHSGMDVSNTAIIKAIAVKCRCSKGTAGTYFYKLRNAV